MCEGKSECIKCSEKKCNNKKYRYDSFEFKDYRETSNGFLDISGIVTRDGVFKYDDGNELRPYNEVFKKESLDSMFAIPVTWEHPPDLLTNETIKDFQKGFVASKPNIVKINDNLSAVRLDSIIIQDPSLIYEIKNNSLREFSLGYSCDLNESVGKMDGEDYVRSQSNIIYNHLAVVSQARCGKVCSIVEKGDLMSDVKKDSKRVNRNDMTAEEKEAAFVKGLDVEKRKEKEDISEEAAYSEGKDVEKREEDEEKEPKWAAKIRMLIEKLIETKKDAYSEEEEKEFVEGEDVAKREKKKKEEDEAAYMKEKSRQDSLNGFSFNNKYSKNYDDVNNKSKNVFSYSREEYLKQLKRSK